MYHLDKVQQPFALQHTIWACGSQFLFYIVCVVLIHSLASGIQFIQIQNYAFPLPVCYSNIVDHSSLAANAQRGSLVEKQYYPMGASLQYQYMNS